MSGLHISNLSHAFGNFGAVNGVSVFVEPGQLVCLLGPSGCGKTTLLRVAAGLETIQRGQIRIGDCVVADGAENLDEPPEKRGIGLMFQDYALFPHLSVIENIRFGMARSSDAREQWVVSALEQMDLQEYRDSYPHVLSGGQQQRVALLRAMAPEPGVLLLDEPFSGLDVTRRAKLREQTLGFLKESGVATLMVTHDPDEAMFMADRILVMKEGRMVQDGTPVEIYFHPASSFVASLFGKVNRLVGTVGSSGQVATPVGTFSTDAHPAGTRMEVLVRPQGVRLAQAGARPPSQAGDSPCQPAMPGVAPSGGPMAFPVVSSRSLGRTSHIVVAIPDPNSGDLHLEAQVPGIFLPEPGSQVSISINAREAHLFPEPDNEAH